MQGVGFGSLSSAIGLHCIDY